jgi:hypothetical protein
MMYNEYVEMIESKIITSGGRSADQNYLVVVQMQIRRSTQGGNEMVTETKRKQ